LFTIAALGDRDDPRRFASWAYRSAAAIRGQPWRRTVGARRRDRLGRAVPLVRDGRALCGPVQPGRGGAADGGVVAAGRQGTPQPDHRARLEPRAAMAHEHGHQPRQARGDVDHLGGDRADLWHRAVLLERQLRIRDGVLHRRCAGAAGAVRPLCAVDRSLHGRAQGRRLASRRVADGAGGGRAGGDLGALAQLGGESVLSRLYVSDRAVAVRRLRAGADRRRWRTG
jgi:hypothetical protein